MKQLSLWFFLGAILVVGCFGCKRDPGPPPPLPAEQIAGEFQKVFGTASPAAKDLSSQVTNALSAKNYPAAHQAIQMLMSLEDLNESQRLIAVRASLTIVSLLQQAQTQGDADAAAALKSYKSKR